jgi:hypothetical protein
VRPCITLAALAIAAVTLALLPTAARAHESRAVGKYQFVVGFMAEPVFVGQMNGVALRVQLPGATPTPVEGLEKTLQVEITHVASGVTRTVPLRTVFRDPGHYTAHLLPTVAGQVRFRFFGTIEGVTVNEVFTSGSGFDTPEPSTEIEFPERAPQVREVAGLAQAAGDRADDAGSTASSARLLAIAALVVAVLSGGPALALAMRHR